MSVKSQLARKAVKKTAKHTARGTVSKLAHRPLRSVTLLALGAVLGGIAGWLIGRAGTGEGSPEPRPGTSGPTSVVTNTNTAAHASETGAVS